MKGILVTTENVIEVKDFKEPHFHSIYDQIGGFEIVNPIGLSGSLRMVVDDDGLLKQKPMNKIGSLLYGTPIHGHPIVGDIVILKLRWTCNGQSLVGLSEQECKELTASLKAFLE